MKEVKVALCGIGGYGEGYVSHLLNGDRKGYRLVAAIDSKPERSRQLTQLLESGVPIYKSLDHFSQGSTCDLMVLCTPIHFHAEQTCWALAHNFHVLCEKPLCVTETEVQKMALAEKNSSKRVMIGYQWSFSKAVQRLKADYLAGLFGRPRRLKALVCWPRDEAYYQRNEWAGKIRDPSGRWILDSPVNNGMAHFLHNMLYLLGPDIEQSAPVRSVEAELFRANSIENYDTAVLRASLDDEVDALLYVSHATRDIIGPVFDYEFERATVKYDIAQGTIGGRFADGTVFDYGCPDEYPLEKLRYAAASIRSDLPKLCGINAASSQVRCVALAQETLSGIHNFASDRIKTASTSPTSRLYVEGLQESLIQCYSQAIYPPASFQHLMKTSIESLVSE